MNERTIRAGFAGMAMLAAAALPAAAAAQEDDFGGGDVFASAGKEVAMPSGIEVRADAALPLLLNSGADSNVAVLGAGLDLRLGYRWGHFGVYLEQEIYSMFWTLDNPCDPDRGTIDRYQSLGASHLGVMAFGSLSDHLSMTFGAALGAMYSNYVGILPRTTALGAASFKLHAGVEYRLERLAVGVYAEYMIAIIGDDHRLPTDTDGIIHFVKPMIGVTYTYD